MPGQRMAVFLLSKRRRFISSFLFLVKGLQDTLEYLVPGSPDLRFQYWTPLFDFSMWQPSVQNNVNTVRGEGRGRKEF